MHKLKSFCKMYSSENLCDVLPGIMIYALEILDTVLLPYLRRLGKPSPLSCLPFKMDVCTFWVY